MAGTCSTLGLRGLTQPLETKCRAPKKRQFWSSREEFTPYGLRKKKKRKRKDRRKDQACEAAAAHPPQLKEKPQWDPELRDAQHETLSTLDLRNITPTVTHRGSARGFHAFTLLFSS